MATSLINCKTALLAVIIWAVAAAASHAQEQQGHCITRFNVGSINWTTGKIKATGKASPADKNTSESPDAVVGAAKADAIHNLISIFKKIPFDGHRSVETYVAADDAVMAGIEESAVDAAIADQHFTSDRAMEVTLETSIFGGFLQLVLPDEIGEIPKIKSIKSRERSGKKKGKDKKAFTGLILDLRGINFKPVLYPVIVSELGQSLYNSVFISREFAVQHGVASYVCSLKEAMSSPRAGNNPMVIKGLRQGGDSSATIVVSSTDAGQIEKATEHHSFFKQCCVVILLGP